MRIWWTPKLVRWPGRVKRLSPNTNICDTTSLVREYLGTVTDRRGPLGDCLVVYVRYGKDAVRRHEHALAVGPTLASVVSSHC